MTRISTIGFDLAKTVFQVHAADGAGHVVEKRRLRRREVMPYFEKLAATNGPCLVGMEACGTAHYWAREIKRLGHAVKLMPPAYVKAYLKRGKSDALDAEAICEAVTRPTMRFVPVKTLEQQSLAMLHSVRSKLVSQRTQAYNALRGHLAELGLIAPKGEVGQARLVAMVMDEATPLPPASRFALSSLVAQIATAEAEIDRLDRALVAEHRGSETSQRLATIPGVGPVTASAVRARIGDPGRFETGRGMAAWLGLTPLEDKSAETERQKRISKKGDRYLRRLLVSGAMGLIRQARRKPEKWPHIVRLLQRMKPKQAAVAIANKTARVLWALLVKGGTWQPGHRPSPYLPAEPAAAA